MEEFCEILQDALIKYPFVNSNGCAYLCERGDQFDMENQEQVERLFKIYSYIKATTALPTKGNARIVGSYGWKHTIERQKWTDENNTYVSNGEVMICMICAGFKPRWGKNEHSPNCEFSISKKSLMEHLKRLHPNHY
jgi:hypothetical protein